MSWIKAVIAGNDTYASIAQVDLMKSADRLFEKGDPANNEDGNKQNKEDKDTDQSVNSR